MVAAQGLTLPNSPLNEEGPPESSQEGLLRREPFIGMPSLGVVFPIGNWRWSTWGAFRETSQELVLAVGGGSAGDLFFPFRTDYRELQTCNSILYYAWQTRRSIAHR